VTDKKKKDIEGSRIGNIVKVENSRLYLFSFFLSFILFFGLRIRV